MLELADRARPHGIEPVVLATGPDGQLHDTFCERGIRVHLLGERRGLSPGLLLRMAAVCRHERIDLLHAHDYGQWLNALLAAAPLRLPVASTFHTPVTPSRRHRLPSRLAARSSAALVACGEEVRTSLKSWTPPGTRLLTIGNGIGARSTDPFARARLRGQLGIAEEAVVVGYVGRLAEEKGVHRLVDVFRRRFSNRSEVQLVLIGPGELYDEIEAQTRDAHNIHLVGEVNDGAALLGAFDIYAQPSFREGRSLALLEAMAAGLPTVATTLPSIRELHLPGETALLVPPGDDEALGGALQRLVGDAPMRRRMGQLAMRAVGRFDIARTVEQYVALYQELVPR